MDPESAISNAVECFVLQIIDVSYNKALKSILNHSVLWPIQISIFFSAKIINIDSFVLNIFNFDQISGTIFYYNLD